MGHIIEKLGGASAVQQSTRRFYDTLLKDEKSTFVTQGQSFDKSKVIQRHFEEAVLEGSYKEHNSYYREPFYPRPGWNDTEIYRFKALLVESFGDLKSKGLNPEKDIEDVIHEIQKYLPREQVFEEQLSNKQIDATSLETKKNVNFFGEKQKKEEEQLVQERNKPSIPQGEKGTQSGSSFSGKDSKSGNPYSSAERSRKEDLRQSPESKPASKASNPDSADKTKESTNVRDFLKTNPSQGGKSASNQNESPRKGSNQKDSTSGKDRSDRNVRNK
eukprot:TRINITY_DN4625_c0_g1_i4.p1 TRINITY_DN4625_c0_g1~~TRINITY_DN4625_c0_g1_i4.p1  ORF type:complete len:305 (+),score=111.34 TRINITY_DN4625_c0_g1_i4:96-917(+)